MANDNKKFDDFDFDPETDEQFSLESILAEFKGSAYISGDKKTPKNELDARVDKILSDSDEGVMTGEGAAETAPSPADDAPVAPDMQSSQRSDRSEAMPDHPQQDADQSTVVPPRRRPPQRKEEDFLTGIREIVTEVEAENRAANDAAGRKRWGRRDRSEGGKKPRLFGERAPRCRDPFDDPEEEPIRMFTQRSAPEEPREEAQPIPKQEPNEPMNTEIRPEPETPIQPEPPAERQPDPEPDIPAEPRRDKWFGQTEERYAEYQEEASQRQDQPEESPSKRPAVRTTELHDDVEDFFNSFSYAHPKQEEEHAEEVIAAVEAGEEEEHREIRTRRRGLFHFGARKRAAREDQNDLWEDAEADPTPIASDSYEEYGAYEEPLYDNEYEEEELEPEPDFLEASNRFSDGLRSVAVRQICAFVLAVLMIVMSFLYELGNNLPFGLGNDLVVLTGILLIMQFIVMALGIDVLVDGVSDLIRGAPGAESLLLLSAVATAADGIVVMLAKNYDRGLPFCAIIAFGVFFALRGKKLYRTAMRSTLRTAVAAANPYGVVTEYESVEDTTVLKKVSATTEGFYRKLTQADICESAYGIAAPLLIIASVVFALLVSLTKGRAEDFSLVFSAMLCACTAFSAYLAFGLPFSFVSRMAKQAGGAVAGWGGACEIYDADGALVTDNDLFPKGTLSISGIKLYEGFSQNKAMIYTSSLIIASGSGLAEIFADLLRSQKLDMGRVEEFACYEGGGVGGVIGGDRVLVGSSGFMNLMGIRVQASENMKNAVFTAVNDELIAVFSVNYIPANSVQNALVTLLKTKISMLFAVRDFNVTPLMIQQKFKVSMKKIDTVPIEDCYRMSDDNAEGCDTLAVLCREGLGPFADVVTRGRQLRIVATLTTMISVIGSVFGLLLMFFLSWRGAYDAASPGNLFILMMAIHIVVEILANLAKRNG